MVNGELVAIPGRPRRTKSACPEQCDASFRLDFHAFEAPLETIGERREIVIEIVEHAFCIVEPQQRPRGAIWLDPATEDRRPEQHCALIHERPQMVDRFELRWHRPRQAMQHVGEPDAVCRFRLNGDGRE